MFIPVSSDGGFSAFVNGKEAEIYTVFDTFMAVKLESGDNTIRISYSVPGMKPSLFLIGAGVLLLIGIVWVLKRSPQMASCLGKTCPDSMYDFECAGGFVCFTFCQFCSIFPKEYNKKQASLLFKKRSLFFLPLFYAVIFSIFNCLQRSMKICVRYQYGNIHIRSSNNTNICIDASRSCKYSGSYTGSIFHIFVIHIDLAISAADNRFYLIGFL